jgi:hypothetical protein
MIRGIFQILPAGQAGNRFLGSLKDLQIRAQASGQIFKDDVNSFSFRLGNLLNGERGREEFCRQNRQKMWLTGRLMKEIYLLAKTSAGTNTQNINCCPPCI